MSALAYVAAAVMLVWWLIDRDRNIAEWGILLAIIGFVMFAIAGGGMLIEERDRKKQFAKFRSYWTSQRTAPTDDPPRDK